MLGGEQEVELGVGESRVGVGRLIEREVLTERSRCADELDDGSLKLPTALDFASQVFAQGAIGRGRVAEHGIDGRDALEHAAGEAGGELELTALVGLVGGRK